MSEAPCSSQSPARKQANLRYIKSLREHAAEAGVNASFRSEPDADKDLCTLVFSRHFFLRGNIVSSGSTFIDLVSKLREHNAARLSNTSQVASTEY